MDSILIVGTGALACLFGARLTASGVRVSILGNWKVGLDALKSDGIRLLQEEVESSYSVKVFADGDKKPLFEHALVLVKSWQTERAAQQLAGYFAPDGKALTLQNGLGNQEILAGELGDNRVLQGTTTTGATLLGPGRVRPGGEGVITLPEEKAAAPFATLFSKAGFDVETTDDLESLLWKKLVVNAGINPVTAMLEIPNGRILESDHAWEISNSLAVETAAVAVKLGVDLEGNDPVDLVRKVAEKTAANHSSMLQDMKRGAPTEIDAICGVVMKFAKQLGIETPTTKTIYQMIKAKVELKQ